APFHAHNHRPFAFHRDRRHTPHPTDDQAPRQHRHQRTPPPPKPTQAMPSRSHHTSNPIPKIGTPAGRLPPCSRKPTPRPTPAYRAPSPIPSSPSYISSPTVYLHRSDQSSPFIPSPSPPGFLVFVCPAARSPRPTLVSAVGLT